MPRHKLTIPAAAGLISTFYIFDKHIGQLSEAILSSVVIAVSLLMSFLMVSTVKYRSVKHLKFQGHHHFMYLVWAVLILVSVMAYPQLMLFMICLGYAMSGLVEKGWSVVRASGKSETMAGTSPSYSDSKE